jgi:triosephosphate isomerase (TIM)
MKYIVIGNWKMNPVNQAEAKKLFNSVAGLSARLKKVDVVVAPPAVYLPFFKSKSKKFFIGAQNTFFEEGGAFTGEISPRMLANLSVRYVIVGHSERRAMGETNIVVNKKIKAVLGAKMIPVLCIGEKDHDHHGDYLSFLREQIREALLGLSRADVAKLIIAYEPIWAIGTEARGAMDSRTLHETVLFIKKVLVEMYGQKNLVLPKILYGGSVDGGNAGDLIEHGNVVGFLVGRASLSSETFGPILKAVDNF